MKSTLLPFIAFLLSIPLGFSQKTYFIETAQDSQKLYIDNNLWDGEAFYTVESGKELVQTLLWEDGYKKEYDILHKNTNHVFTNTQEINVDTLILSQVKPIEIKFQSVDFDFESHIVDHSTYLKDLDHSGELEEYSNFENELDVINLLIPSNQYLINEINEYHNMTIGRYKFYTLGKINSIDLYQVNLNEKDHFIQVFVNVDWSITLKNTEDLPVFPHKGQSGKIVSSTDYYKSQKEMYSLALNDALMSSLLYFLQEQEPRLR